MCVCAYMSLHAFKSVPSYTKCCSACLTLPPTSRMRWLVKSLLTRQALIGMSRVKSKFQNLFEIYKSSNRTLIKLVWHIPFRRKRILANHVRYFFGARYLTTNDQNISPSMNGNISWRGANSKCTTLRNVDTVTSLMQTRDVKRSV